MLEFLTDIIKSLRDSLMRKIAVSLAVLTLMLFGLYLLLHWQRSSSTVESLLINLIASLLATIITVIFVNWIFIQHEERQRLPLKKTALARATLFMDRLMDLIARAVRAATPLSDSAKPRTLDDLLSRRSVERIFLELDLTKRDMPAYANWRDQFAGQGNELLAIAQDLTTVYAGYLPPDVYDLLVELIGREASGLGDFFYHVGPVAQLMSKLPELLGQTPGIPKEVLVQMPPRRLLEVSPQQASPTIDRMTTVFDQIKRLFDRLVEECQKPQVKLKPPYFPEGWLRDDVSIPWGTAHWQP